MFSMHYGAPQRPNERDLHVLDLLAKQTADDLERKRAERQNERGCPTSSAGRAARFRPSSSKVGRLRRPWVQRPARSRCTLYLSTRGPDSRREIGMQGHIG